MSSLNLYFEDDGLSDAGPGRYSDKKTFDVYQRDLQPDGNLSIVQAATMIVETLPGPTENYHRGGELASIPVEASPAHPILGQGYIKLNAVESVQVCLEATSSKRNRQDALAHEYTFYTSLRDFRYRLREWQNPTFDDCPEAATQFMYYINFTAFQARLLHCGFIRDPTFALWSMRDAVEEEIKDDSVFNCCVSAAAMWILCAGQTVFEMVVQLPKRREDGQEYTTGPLFQGPKLGLERWEFWKKLFLVAAERTGADEECERLARRAADLMDSIERNMTW